MNPPSDCQCAKCHTYRAAAPAIKETAKQTQLDALRADIAAEAAAAGDAPVSKTQAKKLRNAERKKLHEEEAKKGDAADLEEDSDWEIEEVPLPTEKEIEAALKLLSMPQPLKEGWTAEAVVNDETALEATSSLAALQQQLAACAKVIQMTADGLVIPGVDVAVTKTKHAALERAVTKAVKDAPSVKVNAAQLRLDKAVYIEERDEKLLFVTKGATNANENFRKAKNMHEQMLQHWTTRLKALEEEETLRQERFAERNAVHEDRHFQVIEEFDNRIQAAMLVASDAAKLVMKKPVVVPDEKEEERKKAQEKAHEEAKVAFGRLNCTCQISKDSLPNLDGSVKATKEVMPVLARMYYWAKASAMGDNHLPYTFREMGATAEVALLLVGQVAWDAMFMKGSKGITSDDICPMQMRQVVFFQLMAYDGALREDKKLQDQEAEALKTLEEAEPRLKRLRLALRPGPYSA